MYKGIRCRLCNAETTFFFEFRGNRYYRCSCCLSLMLDPQKYLSLESEKKLYEEHNNDVEDPRYQQFVTPILEKVEHRFDQGHLGLDFGAGTGPVITKLLREKGYNIELYDPFFWNDHKVLELRYDFIVCCEVIEHFHNPGKEFELLRLLLKPGGSLYCMTIVYSEDIDFGKWHYKNDPTHVFFYHERALAWIKEHYDFSALRREGRLIQFEV